MEVSDHLGDTGVNGRVILKLFLKEQKTNLWTGFMWFKLGVNDRFLWTHANELSGTTKGEEFLGQLSYY